MLSTNFGIATVCIRNSSLGRFPILSYRRGCGHASWISHSVGSQCAFYLLGRGCIGTSLKVWSQPSRVRFLMKMTDYLMVLSPSVPSNSKENICAWSSEPQDTSTHPITRRCTCSNSTWI